LLVNDSQAGLPCMDTIDEMREDVGGLRRAWSLPQPCCS
jgi:hypothetical protein